MNKYWAPWVLKQLLKMIIISLFHIFVKNEQIVGSMSLETASENDYNFFVSHFCKEWTNIKLCESWNSFWKWL